MTPLVFGPPSKMHLRNLERTYKSWLKLSIEPKSKLEAELGAFAKRALVELDSQQNVTDFYYLPEYVEDRK